MQETISTKWLKIENLAYSCDFDLFGVSCSDLSEFYYSKYLDWLSFGYYGDMTYMEKSKERKSVKEIYPWAKSVVCLGINYYHTQKNLKEGEGRIARYAFGRDYHKTIKARLKKLDSYIKEEIPNVKTAFYTDTGAILERAYAAQAGLGMIGKNACLINKNFGSWILLAEIITDIPLSSEKVEKKNEGMSSEKFTYCGGCEKCIVACPAKAFVKPGVLDARKCLSYLSIEYRGEFSSKEKALISSTKRVFGCDICQEVCPHNLKNQKPVGDTFFERKIAGDSLEKDKIQNMNTQEEFLKCFAGSPVTRPKLSGIKRNLEAMNEEGGETGRRGG